MKSLLNRLAIAERRWSEKYVPSVALFFGGFFCGDLVNNWNSFPSYFSRVFNRVVTLDAGTFFLYALVVIAILVLCIRSMRTEMSKQ
jgi:hypothetical protein